jgi:hypothetical protein
LTQPPSPFPPPVRVNENQLKNIFKKYKKAKMIMFSTTTADDGNSTAKNKHTKTMNAITKNNFFK